MSEGAHYLFLLMDEVVCSYYFSIYLSALDESESGGDRTLDPRLKRPLLYHLSYRLDKRKNGFKTDSKYTVFSRLISTLKI